MNDLLKSVELEFEPGANYRHRRLTPASFIKAWQLADFVEDFNERLDMAADEMVRETIENWASEFENKIKQLKERGDFSSGWNRRWGFCRPDGYSLYYNITSETSSEYISNPHDLSEFLARVDATQIIETEQGTWYSGEPYTKYIFKRRFDDIVQNLEAYLEEKKVLLESNEAIATYYSRGNYDSQLEKYHRNRAEKIEKKHSLTLRDLPNRPEVQPSHRSQLAVLAETYEQEYNSLFA